jgi:hypothetical protein
MKTATTMPGGVNSDLSLYKLLQFFDDPSADFGEDGDDDARRNKLGLVLVQASYCNFLMILLLILMKTATTIYLW